jgi:hypothetical protein
MTARLPEQTQPRSGPLAARETEPARHLSQVRFKAIRYLVELGLRQKNRPWRSALRGLVSISLMGACAPQRRQGFCSSLQADDTNVMAYLIVRPRDYLRQAVRNAYASADGQLRVRRPLSTFVYA